MTVKNVLSLAIEELGIYNDVAEYLNSSSLNGSSDARLLLKCFNTVENEIAVDYIPLIKEQTFEVVDGINYNDFESTPSKILSVKNEGGRRVPYGIFANKIKTKKGKVIVKYNYIPKEKNIDGISDFASVISERIMAYGVMAEYLTAKGEYAEASVWEKKYRDALKSVHNVKKNVVLPVGAWV